MRLDQLFWSSRFSEYEGTACAQIRDLSAQSPTDLTRPSGTPGAQAHAYDMRYKYKCLCQECIKYIERKRVYVPISRVIN